MKRPTHHRNYKGELVKIAYPTGKTMLVHDAVVLIRRSSDMFAVVYGLQTTDGLSEYEAMTKLGACMMHQAVCDGN